ncbi:uncharacterized protein VP01_2669g1 [Puccinia sorghi]|uniref:RanBD1 domain-containing protein n=1 Tax=Puccinia sorghi TaxID=27349 RepID=A0A0L6V3X1_9BASI|nr:uncharacterized protein VP01_2669g1 [Puccinia sorghi]
MTTDETKTSTEAHEVKSVREQVEGMGVETQPSSNVNSDTQHPDKNEDGISGKDLPASWHAYADLQSPFACFAPRSTTWSFSDQPPSPSKDDPVDQSNYARAVAPPEKQAPTAPAFALSGSQPGTNSLCPHKFPSGSDFFLKGKRNTSLANSSPEHDEHSASQSKKVKLPPPTTTTTSPNSSSKRQAPLSSISLRSAALEKFNSNPALQTSSAQSSATSDFLKVHPPSSKGSSACADNGESDEPQSSLPNPSPQPQTSSQALGFSAFTTSTGFGDSSSQSTTIDWSEGRSSSVFDQQQLTPKLSDSSQAENTLSEWGGGQTAERKTHLALSAELGQEDKHEGFSATEVITGEENEELVKSVRCKIFTLGDDQSWRERGTGGLRLLRTKEEPYRYRLIMRADAVLRVLLNVPIFKGFSYRPTQDKFLTFASTVALDPPDGTATGAVEPEGKPSKAQFQQYLCRFGKPETRQEMMDSIEECLKELDRKSDSTSPVDPENPADQSADPSDLV